MAVRPLSNALQALSSRCAATVRRYVPHDWPVMHKKQIGSLLQPLKASCSSVQIGSSEMVPLVATTGNQF